MEESVVATMVMDAVVDIFVEGKRGTMDITSAATIYNIRHEDLLKRLVNLALEPGVMIKRNWIVSIFQRLLLIIDIRKDSITTKSSFPPMADLDI